MSAPTVPVSLPPRATTHRIRFHVQFCRDHGVVSLAPWQADDVPLTPA